MASIYDCMNRVRVALNDPRANAPNEVVLLQQVCMQTRTVLRAKRNSGNPWNFADTQIETQPEESLYQIGVSDFGTPLCCLTVDDYSNLAFMARRVPMYIAADFATMENSLPSGAGSWYAGSTMGSGDPNHVATRCNITYRSNVPYIEFFPVGNMIATYSLRYLQSANSINTDALTVIPVPDEDSDLIIVRAAKSLLPYAEWDGNNADANQARRINLRVSLSEDERLAWEQFNAANLVVGGPQTKPRWSGSVVG